MPITVDQEEYLTIPEACEYLGGITRQTLRIHVKTHNIPAYKQGISRNIYYKKSDLDKLKELRPIQPEEDEE